MVIAPDVATEKKSDLEIFSSNHHLIIISSLYASIIFKKICISSTDYFWNLFFYYHGGKGHVQDSCVNQHDLKTFSISK